MKNPEKNTEPIIQTLIRTVITTTVIAAIIYWVHLFPSDGKSKLSLFEMIWSIVFCIVFGGHWLEKLFINLIKFYLPQNVLVLYLIRIAYWFLSAVPLFYIAGLVSTLFNYQAGLLGKWWAFGIFYIGIELVMNAIMQVRFRKSFYNGVY